MLGVERKKSRDVSYGEKGSRYRIEIVYNSLSLSPLLSPPLLSFENNAGALNNNLVRKPRVSTRVKKEAMIESKHKFTKNPSKATPIKNVSLRVGSLLGSPSLLPLLEIKFSRAPTLMTFDARLIGAGNERRRKGKIRSEGVEGKPGPGPENRLGLINPLVTGPPARLNN